MKRLSLAACLTIGIINIQAGAQALNPEYPVLKHYDQSHLAKIALPVGGIGTGTVSLGGRGDLRYWEIMNIPGKQNPGGPNKNDLKGFNIENYTKVIHRSCLSII